MNPLTDYIYIDHKRLDSYFEQISESPVAYDKVPTWKGGVGLTNLGSEVTQSRHPRPFTTYEKITRLLEYLRKGDFLFEFKEEEFYEYLTLGLADTNPFYTSKTIFHMALPYSRYGGTDKKMETYESIAATKKIRLDSYKPADNKKFHLVNCKLRKVVIPSRRGSKQADISLWIYFFIERSHGPTPAFSSTAVLLEDSTRENQPVEMLFPALQEGERERSLPDVYPKWLIKLSTEDRSSNLSQTSLNLKLVSKLGVDLYICHERDFFKYLTRSGAIVGSPQEIKVLYRVLYKAGFNQSSLDSYTNSLEKFRRFLYGAPIFVAAA